MSEPPKPGAAPQAAEVPEPPSRTFNNKMLGFFADASLPEASAPPDQALDGLLGPSPTAPSSPAPSSAAPEDPQPEALQPPGELPRVQAPLPVATAPQRSSSRPLWLGLLVLLLAAGAAAIFFLKK